MKKITIATLFLLFSQFTLAASINFDQTSHTNWYRSTIQTEDFIFTKNRGWMGVNNQNVVNRNAYNGTTDLEMGYGSFTLAHQSGDLFNLSSIDAAISWYNNSSVDELLLTGFFNNGGSISNLLNITHDYQSYFLTGFNDVSHIIFSGRALSRGYVAIDNLQTTSVPEPITFHLLLIGIVAIMLNFRNRRTIAN